MYVVYLVQIFLSSLLKVNKRGESELDKIEKVSSSLDLFWSH